MTSSLGCGEPGMDSPTDCTMGRMTMAPTCTHAWQPAAAAMQSTWGDAVQHVAQHVAQRHRSLLWALHHSQAASLCSCSVG